jgi:hypothetical protein
MLSPCNLYFRYPLGVINEIFTLSLKKKKKRPNVAVGLACPIYSLSLEPSSIRWHAKSNFRGVFIVILSYIF